MFFVSFCEVLYLSSLIRSSSEVKYSSSEQDQGGERAAMEMKSSGLGSTRSTRGMVHVARVLGVKPLPVPRGMMSVLMVQRSGVLRSLSANHRHVKGGSMWPIKTHCPVLSFSALFVPVPPA